MPASVKLTAASPNVLTLRVLGALGSIGSTTGTVLIEPSKSPVRSCAGPQQGTVLLASQTLCGSPLSTQKWNPRIGFVPPWARSYLIRTSPSLRIGVTPLALQSGSAGVRPGVQSRLLNSKSMLVVP